MNASKGKRASAEQLSASFGTDDVNVILELIIQKGDSQESAGERNQKATDKRAEVIAYISKHYVDPKSNRPIPVTRIENALKETKAKIDMTTPAPKQATALIPKLSTVMAMKKGGGTLIATVTVSTKVSSAVSSAIRKNGMATVLRETFSGGKAKFEVDITDQNAFNEAVSRASKGEFDFELQTPAMNGGGASSAAGAADGGGKKGKKGKKKK